MNAGDANQSIAYSFLETRFGLCLVASAGSAVCCVLFADSEGEAEADLMSREFAKGRAVEKAALPVHADVGRYFDGALAAARVPVVLFGTDFQVRTWNALREIPFGEISTYGAIAARLGDARLARAVGTAIGRNPIAHIIPCHKVVRSDGSIGGYRWGAARKAAMLREEGIEA